MNRIKQPGVFYRERKVGTLALYQQHFAAFEYDKDWIENGFTISPFSLPLEKRVFLPKIAPFEGLFGVFADSLPDGWGRLLVDRLLLRNHMNPAEVGNLNRLAPAYDLTYSNSLNGEHATTVNGNGLNPGMGDILAVAAGIGIRKSHAEKIACEIRDCVHDMLAGYLKAGT